MTDIEINDFIQSKLQYTWETPNGKKLYIFNEKGLDAVKELLSKNNKK